VLTEALSLGNKAKNKLLGPLWVKSGHFAAPDGCRLYPSKRTLIESHATNVTAPAVAGHYAPVPILQFFEIAWQIIVWTRPTVRRWSRSLSTLAQ
jgi:hypothetical protein